MAHHLGSYHLCVVSWPQNRYGKIPYQKGEISHCAVACFLANFEHAFRSYPNLYDSSLITLSRMKTTLFFVFLTLASFAVQGQANPASKMKFLVHITCGPDNPTKASLGFLVAKTALAEGHTVSLFLAGDAVVLLQNAQLDKVEGLGTGKLREHFDAIVKAGGKFYLSGNSSKARGVTDADIQGKSAEFALPTKLVQLAADSDRMFTY